MRIFELKGILEVLTGLHIGGGNDAMMIGGIDNAVVKTRDGKPYMPGSSLKGKMRSLLEIKYGLYKDEKEGTGSPCDSDGQSADDITNQKNGKKKLTLLKLFGDPNPNSKLGITRATFGDCYLADGAKEGDQLTEAKYENTVDRKTGTATNPRQTERVCAGVKFGYAIRVKVLESDDETAFKTLLKEGLELVEADYLGGSGSRGYGRVSFTNKEDFEEIGNETI